MTYHILYNDGHALLATGRPIVRAAERQPLADAMALLARLRSEAERRDSAVNAAESGAREAGYREGFAAGQAEFAAAIAAVAAQAAENRKTEETEIAALALAAVQQIAGQLGDAAMMQGIALRAVQAVSPGGAIIVDVPPMLAAQVEAGLTRADDAGSITVRVDPSLGERQCRVTGPNSRIIADLDGQLEQLAVRWGVGDVD